MRPKATTAELDETLTTLEGSLRGLQAAGVGEEEEVSTALEQIEATQRALGGRLVAVGTPEPQHGLPGAGRLCGLVLGRLRGFRHRRPHRPGGLLSQSAYRPGGGSHHEGDEGRRDRTPHGFRSEK